MSDIIVPTPNAPQPRLGRLPAVDHRDRAFKMPSPPSTRTFRSWLSPGAVWDQGQTSQCVSYATNRFLTTHRVVNKPPLSFTDFYHECQLVDEFPGEDYDGTSVRAGFKVLKNMGYVTSYGWATEVEEVVRHLLEVGPVVLGIDWTEDMFKPDEAGYIWPTGALAGGHAIIAVAVNRNRSRNGEVGAIRLLNSWGQSWGEFGRAWISFATLQKLLSGLSGWPGEAATAIEIHRG